MSLIARGAFTVAMCVLGSRFLGIFREMVFAQLIGAGAQKSAYDLAFLLPDTLNQLVSTGYLSITFIPIFAAFLKENQEDEAWSFFSNTMLVLGTFLIAIGCLAWIFTPQLLLWLAQSPPSEFVLQEATSLCRIVLPAQIFFFAGTLLTAVQHIRQRFFIPAFSGVVYNAAIIIGGFLGRHHGVSGFAWGVLGGAFVANFLMQIWGATLPYRLLRLRFNPLDPQFLRYIYLTLPFMTSLGVFFSLEYTYRAFGFYGGENQVALLGYAYRLAFAGVGVLGYSVGVASYPQLVKWAQEEKWSEIGGLLTSGVSRLILIAIPLVLTMSAGAPLLVSLLLQRGAFTANDTLQVSMYLRIYSFILFSLSAQALVLRAFYAQRRFWYPSLVNTSLFLLSIPIYHLIIPRFGVYWIPVIGVSTTFVQWLTLYITWLKPPFVLNQKKTMQLFSRMALSLLIGCVLNYLYGRFVHLSNTPSIVVSISWLVGIFVVHGLSQWFLWHFFNIPHLMDGPILPAKIQQHLNRLSPFK